MKRLQETKPIWHAVVWIAIYVGVVNLGDMLSSTLGVANLATSLLLVVLSLTLLFYVRKNHWLEYYGLASLGTAQLQPMLFYIPLVAIAFIQYLKGFNPDLDLQDIVIIVVLMVCVGFLEELLFRGFLFQAILKTASLNRAVIISGITFGIGHIVNLARGYSTADQAIQIVAAIFIGLVLACCVAMTKTILPGVIFHALFNISGSVTNNNLEMETTILIAIVVISLFYSLYLKRFATVRAPLPA